MRILITNDDGVFAPGIAALARGLHAAFGDAARTGGRGPADRPQRGRSRRRVRSTSGSRSPTSTSTSPGWPTSRPSGSTARPALSVILACIEGFGPRPDLVVSGINHGINAGRSALHSGTVGAALTGAQFGVRGLAVSIAWASEPDYWETAVGLACGIVPRPGRGRTRHRAQPQRAGRAPRRAEGAAPRRARPRRPDPDGPARAHARCPVDGSGRRPRPAGPSCWPCGASATTPTGSQERAELEPDSDAALVEDGWASLTPLVGRARERLRCRAGAMAAPGRRRTRRRPDTPRCA